jgi:lipoprotein-anchoring transpeptidase ErfK/SrfK
VWRNPLTLVVVTLVVLLGGGVLLANAASDNTIPDGVTAGGVALGGLDARQAQARLQASYAARVNAPVVLTWRHRRFFLRPKTTGVSVDIAGAVQEALAVGQDQSFFTRAWRSLTDGHVNADVTPAVSFSHRAVHRFVERVRSTVELPALDATIAFQGGTLGPVKSHAGRAIDGPRLTSEIESAVAGGAHHAIGVPLKITRPHVTEQQLGARYPTVITIDRSAFTLRLFKRLRLVRSYTIAVGMAGLATPAGEYHITDKEVDPSWHVPNSAWAGSLAGRTIPPGPSDPLKARWMGIYNGAGIHGTDVLSSLGSAASHGCIRMAIPDVIELYSETPLGTPVFIA